MQNKKEKNMFCVHVLYVVISWNVPDTFLGKKYIYVVIQLRILRISIMLSQGINLRTSLAPEFNSVDAEN